jgi:folylpolyglutamate synthase/dihydropteroate synthase
MQVFADTWTKVFDRRKAVALFTTREDKNFRAMWKSLAPCISAWVGCPLPHSPGIERDEMQTLARRSNMPFEWCDTPMAGYHRVRELARPGGLSLVAGSHYLVGDVIPPPLIVSPSQANAPMQKPEWHDILQSLRMPS